MPQSLLRTFHTSCFTLHDRSGQALRLRSGQAMILAVMALGGAILGATTIAGFLMVYQIRQTTDLTNSAKAIFAADAGVGCALYNNFIAKGTNDCTESQTFSLNGAAFSVECADANGATIPAGSGGCGNASSEVLFSLGNAVTARRAFSVNLSAAAQIFP